MSCYRSSNNRYFNSPSRMSDGRNFTDYRSSYELNKHIIEKNKIANTHDFRMFLNRNGDNIIKENNKYIAMMSGSFNCKQPYEVGTMLPEKTRLVCNQHTCKEVLVNENGIGQGREYSLPNQPNSLLEPLKKPEYVFDDNICTNIVDNFNYYPIDKKDVPENQRQAVPGGGNMLSGGDSRIIN